MNTKKTLLLTLILTASLGAGAITPVRGAGPQIQAAAEKEKTQDAPAIIGTWIGTVTGDPSQPTFPSLLTFHADGTALFSAAGPPVPGLGNPGHGVWKQIGARKYVATFVQMTFATPYLLDGGLKVSMAINLDSANAFTTKDSVTIYNLAGREIVTLTGTQVARRLELAVSH